MNMLVAVICLLVCVVGAETHLHGKEPMCTSQFDFIERMLDKVLRMEIAWEQLQKRVEEDLEQFGKYNDIFKLEMERVNEASGDMAANFRELEKRANEKLTEMEQGIETAVEKMERKIDSSIKPDVVFHVRDIAKQPAANAIIQFSKVVEDTHGAYDEHTGCFKAPVKGTYWFSAHMCTLKGLTMVPSIIIRDTVVSRTYVYQQGHVGCSTANAVSVLQVGDTVCLKAGPIISTSAVWTDDRFNSNSFMGAIMN